MKTKYERPRLRIVSIGMGSIIAASTIKQNVYTDDPQSASDALVKEGTYFDFTWE